MLRTGEATAFWAAVRAHRTVRVDLDALTADFAAAVPRLAADVTARAELAASLDDLADAGRVELPAARSWDRTAHPPLPRFVNVPEHRSGRRDRPWVRFPWTAPLGWVASLTTLSDTQFADLRAVHDWLIRRPGDVPVVPVRCRSVEILGNEKRLDQLLGSALAGPGRLDETLLAVRRYPPPIPAASVGNGPDILAVENSDAYWVAVAGLEGGAGPVGTVAWGSGRAFPASVPTLAVDVAGRGPATGTVHYVGDIDPAGVNICAAAITAGTAAGVTVRPALGLWDVLAGRTVQDPGTVAWRDMPPSPAVADLWGTIAPVRNLGGRVAEESLIPDDVAAWAATLPVR